MNEDRSWTIANPSACQQAHPVANPTDPITGDFEPGGTWYSMIAVRGDLYAIEPNHGELDKITPSREVSRVVDISEVCAPDRSAGNNRRWRRQFLPVVRRR